MTRDPRGATPCLHPLSSVPPVGARVLHGVHPKRCAIVPGRA